VAETLAKARRTPFRLGLRAAVVLALGGFLALLAYGLAAKSPDRTLDESLARSRAVPAPGFTLDLLSAGRVPQPLAGRFRRAAADGRVELGELRGMPLVLNFWASWCGPCREEAPLLERAWLRMGPRGVLFLGLNMQDITADARAFLGEFSLSYPNVREPGREVARRYGVTGLPETFFISARGRAVGHVIGVVSPEQLEAGIAGAVDGRAVARREGGDRRPTR
jgi:cytochrome c biogenesis protein CcmG/thiol:disulfide interchange protein DsbE